MKLRRLVLLVAAACAMPLAVAGAPAPESATAAAATRPSIAVVNGRVVTVEEFERAMAVALKQKFYHGTPPEGQIDQVARDVADGLVDKSLLIAEAEKRGVAVDEEAIKATLDGYEKRYGSSPNWAATRERALPEIRRELTNQQLLTGIERDVRAIPEPDDAAVRAFYDANNPLFTEPERIRVAVILLKVDPAAPKKVRDEAREEGRSIHERLVKGADFAELAKIHSADPSAAKGGDLGYLHRGMLSEALHNNIDSMKPGDISASLDVLDGVAIFRLLERQSAKLRDFPDVRARAAELLKREQSDAAWKRFVADLRSQATIQRLARYPGEAASTGTANEEPTWAAPGTRGP
jgi:parvulin-like peptidyl-prolyl isomerase